MGRQEMSSATKTAANRHKVPLQLDRAQINDPFPEALVEFLVALPSSLDLASDPEDRPSKRIRLEGPEPIVIARETLEVSRPSRQRHTKSHSPLSFSRPDVGQHLKLQLVEESSLTHVLTFISTSRSPYGSIKTELCLGRPQFSKALVTVLNVATRSRDTKSSESGLWTNCDITFDRGQDTDRLRLSFELRWNQSLNIFRGMRNATQRAISKQVQETFFPTQSMVDGSSIETLAPQAFYEAAFIPETKHTSLLSLSIPHLTSKLYPFQRRALEWLLQREGVRWSEETAGLQPCPRASDTALLPLSFAQVQDADGKSFYLSDLFHTVSRDAEPYHDLENLLRGGILAEEMGLGKTVETISLILMHRRSPQPPSIFDAYTQQHVRPTGATLIVTPVTLKKQWLAEFEKHAPYLRVMTYDGLKGFKGQQEQLVSTLAEQDVVITTYSVLQAEIHFAAKPPDRSMRHERLHARPKSPLVALSWWRVCLDEAQQIESGVSAAAKVARQIPRINAWGITGTPVKENIKDLWGLLLFLRYEPYASYPVVWESVTTTHKTLFKNLFHRIALRHTKRSVRSELVLPPQKRYVISMPLTAIEEQHYSNQFQALARSCGLDNQGHPLEADWDPDDPVTQDLMKRALAQLRQTVLHPELGPGRLRTLAQRNKPLRTIEEVLDAMIEQSESAIKTDQRTYLANKLKRGQLLENSPRVKEALAIWEQVLEEVEVIVAECREQLQVEMQNAKQAGITESEESENEEYGVYKDPSEESIASRLGDARRRLRSALDIQHRAVFFIASAHFQIKSNEEMTVPDSDEFKRLEQLEISTYEHAKELRREILQESHGKASFYMERLGKDAGSQSFVEIPEFKSIAHKGLESRRMLENLEQLCAILDGQANLIDEWREHFIQLLLRPLVDEEGEAEITGEEYQNSTDIQSDLMVYSHVLRAAIGDRQDALTGQINDRVRHETKTAEAFAKNGEGPAPEKMLELLQLRKDSKPTPVQGSLRGVVTDMRELATKLRHDAANGSNRAKVELEIVQEQLKLTQDQINEQSKAASALEKELDRFTAAMNARVEFYRQLQAVSDTVAPWEREKDEKQDEALMKQLVDEEAVLQRKVVGGQSKHRYLLHLKEAGQDSQEPKFCVICQSTFTLGVLTICGHQFCKDCMTMWFKAHRNCPICKKALTLSMLNDITLKKQELRLHKEQAQVQSGDPESSNKSRRVGIYAEFGDEKLQAIKNIELEGPSFATKIDTLIRHLLWLREADPGAKSIIFSQFGGFLDVLSRAFARFRIGFTSFDKKDGITQFKEDPGIECFLMDARAHASGLNLVNASHVFLCEPLLNTALELQAIARVDRIGQEHETTVWLYLVEESVEASIYALSVQRRLEHMGRDSKGKSKESTPDVSDLNLEAANSMELQQAALSKLMSKDKQLGEVVDKNDLWECLFGHVNQGVGLQDSQALDERFSNPAVMGFLAREAAETRMTAERDSATKS